MKAKQNHGGIGSVINVNNEDIKGDFFPDQEVEISKIDFTKEYCEVYLRRKGEFIYLGDNKAQLIPSR